MSLKKVHEGYQSQIPIKKALKWILFSILSVLLLAGGPLWYYKHLQSYYAHDDAYLINSIVQTTSNRELLPTPYLAEQMQLSFKHPVNLYQFNSKEAEIRLQSNPLIKWVQVKKIRPGTIYIDYAVRQPIAYLKNFANTEIDAEGFIFASTPFFTPKKNPEIYLNATQLPKSFQSVNPIGHRIAESKMELIRELIGLTAQVATLKRIDLSKVDAVSLGRKQIVLVLEEQWERSINGKPVMLSGLRVLRLNVDHYRKGITAYMVLQKHLAKETTIPDNLSKNTSLIHLDPLVIDLRLPHLAYLWKFQTGNHP